MVFKFLLRTLGALFFAISITTSTHASTIDWSTVALDGTFPSYTFIDATLGTVNVNYSIDTELPFYGIRDLFGSDESLAIGNTGGELLTLSWTNTVFNMEIPIWDVDAFMATGGESVTFATSATVSPVSLHSSDVWDASTLTLSNDGTENANQNPFNFTLMRFVNPAGFNSVTFNLEIADGITGGVGVGDLTINPVPVPAAIWLFGSGLIGLIGIARRKQP